MEEAVEEIGVRDEVGKDLLDRDPPAGALVDAEKDLRHPAEREPADDRIVVDPLRCRRAAAFGHGFGILRGYTPAAVTHRPPAPPALAVLDVGFHRHPDLAPRRVLACIDATGRRAVPFRYGAPGTGAGARHRTMLLAAGSGRASASSRPRRGPRSSRESRGGRARSRAAIVRAFRWLVAHAERFGIRVVLCPLGDDAERRGDKSEVPALVAALAARRVVVVAAAGWDPANEVVSPARSPHAIGVGGWDVADDRPARGPRVGVVEGFLKPDFLAPAVPPAVPCLF